MSDDPHANDAPLPEPSGEFAELLDEMVGGPVFVPEGVDRAVLDAAHARLLSMRRRRVWMRRVLPGAGAAAAAAIVVAVWLSAPFVSAPRMAATPLDPVDLDRNGRVDILDAFSLARRIEQPESLSDELDFNTDGRIDQDDVDLIAARAVRLPALADREGGAG